MCTCTYMFQCLSKKKRIIIFDELIDISFPIASSQSECIYYSFKNGKPIMHHGIQTRALLAAGPQF